jgi:hypothetical protein
MKLYQTPRGTIAGNEKDWKAAMKAEGHDTKTWSKERCSIDVPTAKAELMEFLTFHTVNVVNPPPIGASEVTGGDPSPAPQSPSVAPPPTTTTVPLEEVVRQAPLPAQLDLVVGIIDRAAAVIRSSIPAAPRD